ncbi:hypothetical protein LZT99_05285 [Staphylococcus epidermidis]|nr:hypothetical protein [Staphylococcus epidermidis]
MTFVRMKYVLRLKYLASNRLMKILKTIGSQIHEEVTHMHPNYYFSTSQRHHRYQ